MRNVLFIITYIFLSIAMLNCSDDDKHNNPTTNNGELNTVGLYIGTNSMGKSITIEISNVSGFAYVTTIDITFADSTSTGSFRSVDSKGIVEVIGSSFFTKINSSENEHIGGAITTDKIEGSFKINFNGEDLTGTYTAIKQ